MASANVELVRQAVEAVNERNEQRLIELVVTDFEWITPVPSIAPKLYRGAGGVREFFADASPWEKIEGRIEQRRDLGDRALLLGELAWHGHGESLDVTGPLASVVHFADGKIKRIHTYRDANDAWTAAGLGRPRH